jgi:hypothetical protein
MDDRGSIPGRDRDFFSSLQRPDCFWDLPSLLPKGYHDLFPWGQSGRGMKLTTHLHLVPKSRMRGAILSFPQYAFMTWCSVKKKHRDNFTFAFTFKYKKFWEDLMTAAFLQAFLVMR